MGIFRRGSKATSADLDPSITASDGGDSASADGAQAAPATTTSPSRPSERRGGPFDRSEVKDLDGRLDLGALWLTGLPGMELRLEVEEESQNVVGVTAVVGDSAVQLQAFAAPRSEGIWDDIRTEIAASITSQGGTADKTSGPLGDELRAQMPSHDPNGHTVFSSVRFVGVDGPRWFLRGVLSGPAAVDEGAAEQLLDVVRSTVVVRGDEAMAPRELLSLKLPEQPEPADEAIADEGAEAGQAPSVDDFKPFERGPEITEIH
ncbi:MAG TPA: DUF3710 domain-containing protein [Dermatophilaceae bacterium]